MNLLLFNELRNKRKYTLIITYFVQIVAALEDDWWQQNEKEGVG